MPLLLHAISTAELALSQHEKLTKLGLVVYSHADLSALVTVCRVADITTADHGNLLGYSQLIEATRIVTDIIPMRYGTVIEDEHTLYQTLESNRKRFSQQLQQISGCVEMSVRLPIHPTTTQSTTLSGREYLQEKQQKLCSSQVELEQITDVVAGYYANKKVEYVSSSSLLRIHFLVKNTELKPFQQAVHTLQLPQLFVSGPWAAYHFVN